MINDEGGIIAEEFRVEYVVDRVDTTATVWLGLTVELRAAATITSTTRSRSRSYYQLLRVLQQRRETGPTATATRRRY